MQPPPARRKRPREFLRGVLLRMMALERRHHQQIRDNKDGIINRLTHSHFFSLQPGPISRGFSIGMFWAFIPMPFQMFPAFIFCWLGRANLPLAILCVWLSNPLTYAPFFYSAYYVGNYASNLMEGARDPDADSMSFENFNQLLDADADAPLSLGSRFADLYITTLQGSIILGCIAAVVAYFAGFWLSDKLQSYARRRREKKYANSR